jgi:hypothetical protein
MRPPVVLLDACTLYPAALRDVLMRMALHRLIQARWTDAIHDEWINAVLRNRPDLSREKLQRTRELMDLHAEDSLVTGYEPKIQELEIVLTWNTKDFPEAKLKPHGIHTEPPDHLISRILEAHPETLLLVLRQARLSLLRPPATAEEYLETLRIQGLTRTCELLQPFHSEL